MAGSEPLVFSVWPVSLTVVVCPLIVRVIIGTQPSLAHLCVLRNSWYWGDFRNDSEVSKLVCSAVEPGVHLCRPVCVRISECSGWIVTLSPGHGSYVHGPITTLAAVIIRAPVPLVA